MRVYRDHTLEIALWIFVAIVACCYSTAHADDGTNVHLKSAATCTTVKGSIVTLPPGVFLSDDKFAALDAELKRQQDLTTRLTAENASFRAQAPGWQPGWKSITLSILAGMAAVIAIDRL